jgi:hypothetical protein
VIDLLFEFLETLGGDENCRKRLLEPKTPKCGGVYLTAPGPEVAGL